MRIYFSGIGGTGIGPLALIAHQAGYDVCGSDKQMSNYISYLQKHGLHNIHIGQTQQQIAAIHAKTPIDWFVYSSALSKENPDHPELSFVTSHGIKHSKRDAFLNHLLQEKNLKLLAIAGTHGKTTTTAMVVWLFKQLGIPVSYSVGAKITFGEMGEYVEGSEYFVYEADEYDRNFLSFKPHVSIISGIDYDHPDIYPSRDEYYAAFRSFIADSHKTIIWQEDANKLALQPSDTTQVLNPENSNPQSISLIGQVNRNDGWLAVATLTQLNLAETEKLIELINRFPGLSRRFEQLQPNLYSDYAHTPDKIRGALQTAHETAGDSVVVVYEGLHNTRQHFIANDLAHLFDNVKQVYVVPSYLAREDPNLQVLSPQDIVNLLHVPEKAAPAALDADLKSKIENHLKNGDLVLCLTAGGGGSLDEWLRNEFTTTSM